MPYIAQAAVFNSLADFVSRVCIITGWMFYFALVVALFFILYTGFLYITGSNDPKKISEAHWTLVYVIVGIAAAFLATSIPKVTASFFGINAQGC